MSTAPEEEEKETAITTADIHINRDADLYKEGAMQPDREDGKSEVEVYTTKMTDIDKAMVYSTTVLPDAPAPLPAEPSELTALDPAFETWESDQFFDGRPDRLVHIRQIPKRQNQSPDDRENTWTIGFEDEGESANKWANPLMGWKSGADAMCSVTMNLEFENAKEAAYFAKTRGWSYIVEEPILRESRDDGATYQDNFLSQIAASRVMSEGKKCDLWSRDKSGASHYFRPLNYHGTAEVNQYGPNPKAPIEKDVEGEYKMR